MTELTSVHVTARFSSSDPIKVTIYGKSGNIFGTGFLTQIQWFWSNHIWQVSEPNPNLEGQIYFG